MSPEKVYERFLKEFPDMESQVVKWYTRRTTTALASIRILLRNHRTLIFSINKDGTWILKRK
ncbi:MAG: hypothetical protein J5965_10220 [Aeriscardovia sp.]|nr:hypothetical protein [Aeriscardovia sp.]